MGSYSKAKGNNFDAVNSEVNYCIQSRQYYKAISIIDEYLSHTNDKFLLISKAHCLIALSNQEHEKLEEARSIINGVLSEPYISFGAKKYALSELARIETQEKNELVALEYYKQIINESGRLEPAIRCKIASIYIYLNMYDHALGILEVPNFNIESMNVRRCQAYLQQKKFEEALAALRQPIFIGNHERDGRDYDVTRTRNEKNYYLGCIYHSLYNDLEKAESYFESAIKEGTPTDKSYWASVTGIISIYYSSFKFDKCISYCEQFLKGAPKSNKNYNKVLRTYIKTYVEKRDYNRALEIAKSYNCEELITYIEALSKIANNQFVEAYPLLDSFYDTDDDGLYAETLFKKLGVLFRLDKVEEFDKVYNELFIFSSRSKHIRSSALSMKFMLYKKHDLKISNYPDTYFFQQMHTYSKDKFKQYVIEKFGKRLNPEIDIEVLLDEIQSKIETMNPLCDNEYDLYYVPYRNIGVTSDGKNIHTLLVKCLPDTKNIILITPNDNYGMETDDLVITSSKQKRLSQIDKFKKRYGDI